MTGHRCVRKRFMRMTTLRDNYIPFYERKCVNMKIKTFLKNKKKEIIMLGAVLTTSCIGGLIGSYYGCKNTKFEINLIGSNGEKIKELV